MQTSDERGLVLVTEPDTLDQAAELALDVEIAPDLDAEEAAADDMGEGEPPAILDEVLIEEVSIDGMCGVY